MVSGANQPLPNKVPVKVGRIGFNLQVIDDAAQRHNGELNHQHVVVHWQENNSQRQDDGLEQPLEGMKGKAGPGAGRAAVVVHFVQQLKNGGPVHPAVQPVVVGFVNEQRQPQADRQPPEAILLYVNI